MRTNIEIDDRLMRAAMKATGAATKKAAVEEAMRLTVQMKKQERIRELFGTVEWDGDLMAMRESRFLNEDGYHRLPGSTRAVARVRSRRPRDFAAD